MLFSAVCCFMRITLQRMPYVNSFPQDILIENTQSQGIFLIQHFRNTNFSYKNRGETFFYEKRTALGIYTQHTIPEAI